MTGPPEAAKAAAAYMLAGGLRAEHRRAEVLDGLFADAGRVGVMAEVLARNGIVAIVLCGERADAVRARHESSGTRYVEVPVTGQSSAEELAAAVHSRLVARS
jgi:adenylylsulfate kinase-like enzyme